MNHKENKEKFPRFNSVKVERGFVISSLYILSRRLLVNPKMSRIEQTKNEIEDGSL